MIRDQSISIQYDMEWDMDEDEADNMSWDKNGPSRADTPMTGLKAQQLNLAGVRRHGVGHGR